MIRSLALGAALVLAPAGPSAAMDVPLPVVKAQTNGPIGNRAAARLQRAGTRGGAYCATYKGRNHFDRFPLARSFFRSACFTTRARCDAWFYDVQSAFPIMFLRKPCRRRR